MITSGWGPRAAPANGEAKPVEGGGWGARARRIPRAQFPARVAGVQIHRARPGSTRGPRSPGEFPPPLGKVALRFGLADLLSGMR